MVLEVQHRTGVGDRQLSALSAAQYEPIAGVLRDFCAEASDEGAAYVYEAFLPGRRTATLFAYPVHLASLEAPAATCDDLGAALEHVADRLTHQRTAQELRARLEGAVAAALAHICQRQERYRSWLAKAQASAEQARQGALIMAQLHAIPAGATEARVIDYHHQEQPEVVIPIDPALGPRRSAQRYFEAHRRGRRVLKRVPPLLEAAEQEERYLQSVAATIELAGDAEELGAVEEELLAQGIIKPKKRPASRGAGPRSCPALRVRMATGFSMERTTNTMSDWCAGLRRTTSGFTSATAREGTC